MISPLLAMALMGDLIGLILITLLIQRYRADPSRPLLYMLLPIFSLIAYAITMSLVIFLTEETADSQEELNLPVALLIGQSAFMFGFHFLSGNFFQKVFRPGDRRAQIFLSLMGAGIALSFIIPFFLENVTEPNPATATRSTQALYVLSTTSLWIWGMYECFSHWRAYTADLARGKDLDPLIVNRFFLWGIPPIGMILAGILTFAFNPGIPMLEQPSWIIPAISSCMLPLAAPVYFSWYPPRWYRRRFENSTSQ